MKLYRTHDIERAVHEMAKTHLGVLVRTDCRLHKKIRIRPKLLQDLNPYVVKWSAGAKYLEKWHAHGGVLLYYIAPGVTNNLPEHECQVIVEMPSSPKKYEQAVMSTTEAVVIYQPPTWDGHREAVNDRWPDVRIVKAYWEFIRDAKADRPLCEALEVPVGRVIDEDAIRQIANMRTDQFRAMRRSIFGREQWHQVMKIGMRQKPEEGTFRVIWDYLFRCPVVDGCVMVLDNELSKVAKFHKAALRIMVRRGYVAIKENCTVYYLGLEPDFDKLTRKREEAMRDLDTMIAMVEATDLI